MATTSAYPVVSGYYPTYSPPVVAFYFAGLARSSGYNGAQYYITNTDTWWTSGWQSTPPWSYSNGYSSNFNIPMSPGYSYTVQFRINWDNQWWDCEQYSSFHFQAPRPNTPSAYHHSSSDKTIYIQVVSDGTVSSIEIKPSWSSYWSSYTSTNGTFGFEAPEWGTEYTIAVRGVSSGGTSGDKLAYVMSEPRVPSLTDLGVAGGQLRVGVTTSGSFDRIEVALYTAGGGAHIATRTLTSTAQSPALFGSLTPNASYQVRATVYKSARNYNYNPIRTGGWLPVKYTIARPSNWEWYTPKSSGALFSMSANEWNTFMTRINQFREYKGLDTVAFSSATSGGNFHFYQFNEARNAINALASTGVSTVSSWTPVSASSLNILRNTLNVIT